MITLLLITCSLIYIHIYIGDAFINGRKRKMVLATIFPPNELKDALDSFLVPEGYTRLYKSKSDTSGKEYTVYTVYCLVCLYIYSICLYHVLVINL
jgi:hypothetical protein